MSGPLVRPVLFVNHSKIGLYFVFNDFMIQLYTLSIKNNLLFLMQTHVLITFLITF